MSYETLLVELKDRVAIIRINRLETMNALDHQMRTDLVACFKELAAREDVRVVILTGIGRAFCAGADLQEIEMGRTAEEGRKYMQHASSIIQAIQDLEKPVIAAVNGPAVGAGFSISTACDLIVASEKAVFAQSFIRLGLVPGMGGTYFTTRLVGLQKAKELAFTGMMVKAPELERLGAVNYVVAPDEVESKALELAARLADGPPLALALTKKLMNQGLNSSLPEQMALEGQTQAGLMQSEDHMEGIRAFLEKRKPEFKGK